MIVRSIAFALLLLVSLGTKLMVGNRLRPSDDATLIGAMTVRLAADGYTVTTERRQIGAVVTATRGLCVMQLRDGDRGAEFGAAFAQIARTVGPPSYLYRGALSPTPPGLRRTLEALVQHQLGAIGVAISRPAVIMIARRSTCGATLPDLGDLHLTMH
jgi:hypothetical protein